MSFRPREGASIGMPNRVRTTGNATRTEDPDDRMRARAANATAYEKYKAQLNEFFDGKRELPQQLKEILSTRPGAEDHGFPDDASADAPDQEASGGKKKRRGKKGVSEKSTTGTRRRVVQNGDQRAALVEALRRASSPRESEQAVDALRTAGFPIPLELDLLSKALSHKDEAIIAEALRGLGELIDGPGVKSASLLKGRIQNVALLASSSEVRELCSTLQSRLA